MYAKSISKMVETLSAMIVAPVKVRRHYDATFKREAVALWLASGKSAEVVGHALGLSPGRLFAWRSFLARPVSQQHLCSISYGVACLSQISRRTS